MTAPPIAIFVDARIVDSDSQIRSAVELTNLDALWCLESGISVPLPSLPG